MIVGAVGALLSLAFWRKLGRLRRGRPGVDAGSSRTTSSEASVQPPIARHERNNATQPNRGGIATTQPIRDVMTANPVAMPRVYR